MAIPLIHLFQFAMYTMRTYVHDRCAGERSVKVNHHPADTEFGVPTDTEMVVKSGTATVVQSVSEIAVKSVSGMAETPETETLAK